ncbi:MAG: sigma 54-interacting transcriptional regulator [Nitrospira sp.]
MARAIHRLSTRAERTFVKLNCAAIPTGLLAAQRLPVPPLEAPDSAPEDPHRELRQTHS